jgi:hypothetical protein
MKTRTRKPVAKCTDCTCGDTKGHDATVEQPSAISIVVGKENVDARLQTISTLAEAVLQLANALNAPTVSLSNCVISNSGTGISMKSK